MNTHTLIEGSYQELQPPTTSLSEWHSEVITATELVINGYLMKLPWFASQRTHIERTLGGYSVLFQDTLELVIAHCRQSDDCLPNTKVMKAAVLDIGRQLRGMFDNTPYTNPLEKDVDIVFSSLLNDPLSPAAERLVALAPDDRGRELLLDVAAGTSLRSAADNNGIRPQTAHERMGRIRKKAQEASNVRL